MTDLEVIACWVNPGELFATARHNRKESFNEKDVYYIKQLGNPTGANIDLFYKAFAATRKRLVVSGVEDPLGWVKYFNRASELFMEIEDDTFIFDRSF